MKNKKSSFYELTCPCWTSPKENLCQRHIAKSLFSVPKPNTPPNSLKSRNLKAKPKKVSVNPIKRNTERNDHGKN